MAERRENSVLFSLKELREIENSRVQQERDAAQARAEAEVRAREEAERKAREEAERKTREEQDRIAKAQADHEKTLREEQLRLEAEKHRAQVEAQAKLEAARIHAEVQAKALEKKAPKGVIYGAIGGVVLALGALAYVFLVFIPQRDELAAKKAQDQIDQVRVQLKNAMAESEMRQKQLQDELEKTTDNAKKAEIQAKIAAAKRDAEQARQNAAAAVRQMKRSSGAKSTSSGSKGPKCDPAIDPLCGSGVD
jgi:hypothetical protein